MKLKTSVILTSFAFMLIACDKKEVNDSRTKTKKLEIIDAKVKQAKQESKIWYDHAINKIKENQRNKHSTALLSSTSNYSGIDLVNDTAFVGLLYETINSNLNTYSYYLNEVGDENFQNFVTTLTANGTDPVQAFNYYDVQVDYFINNMSGIFAQAALTLQNNPDFSSLTIEQQNAVLQNAIDYYFPSNNYQGLIPPSGIQVNGLMEEIGGCLFDAVGGYIIGNARLVRDIYNAINGSSLGYSFVYAMSGRILKQSLSNAGGWFSIAASFAWCMIF